MDNTCNKETKENMKCFYLPGRRISEFLYQISAVFKNKEFNIFRGSGYMKITLLNCGDYCEVYTVNELMIICCFLDGCYVLYQARRKHFWIGGGLTCRRQKLNTDGNGASGATLIRGQGACTGKLFCPTSFYFFQDRSF